MAEDEERTHEIEVPDRKLQVPKGAEADIKKPAKSKSKSPPKK
jgi:hypothetical protein